MDDALGHGGDDRQADLGKRIGGRVEHARYLRRNIADLLLARGRDKVAGKQRAAEEIALQRLRRALQPHLPLGGSEHDTLRRTRFGFSYSDMIARSDFGIGALQAVEANDLQPFVLGIGQHGAGGSRSLAVDFDDVAFDEAKRRHGRLGHAGDSVAALGLPRSRDLQPDFPRFHASTCFGHFGFPDCLGERPS